jgi:polyhydroxybutyrate depolymerase
MMRGMSLRSAARPSAAVVGLFVAATLAAGCTGGGRDARDVTAEAPAATTTPLAPKAPVPSPGCTHAGNAPATARERRTISVAGEERWYLLTAPSAHDGATPLPLVVELHGLAEGAAIAAQMSQFDTVAEREGFVMAYPNGSGSPVRWDQHLDARPNADFAFLDQLLDQIGEDLCIDRSRVYATGLSYGAIMSSALACARSERFAAIAPVSGVTHPDGCTPGRAVPVLTFHGTVDPILYFNGGVGNLTAAFSGGTLDPPPSPVDLNGPGYPEAVAGWAAANGCGASVDERRSDHVIERTYDCEADAEVRFFIIEGGGHSWPGSAFSASIEKIVGPTTSELDATEEIWRFFERHRLPSPR